MLIFKKKFFITLSFILSLFLSCHCVYALNSKVSITVLYDDIGYFSLYKIADIADDNYTLTQDFAEYKVDLDIEDSETLRELADILEGYVQRDNIEPLKEGHTDNGQLVWNDLEIGIYLVVGERVNDEVYVRTFSPALIYTGNQSSIEITPKYEDNEIKLINKKVMKVWKNDNESVRPSSIQVQLLKNVEIYDTVTLNKDNNWQYRWDDLSNIYEWKIVEKVVPDNYTVTSKSENEICMIINTYAKDVGKNADNKIPQTGQLWWPVPLLTVFGLTAFIIGWIKKKEA